MIEWTSAQSRTLMVTLNSLGFTFGQALMAAMAYSVRNWPLLQLAVSAPFFLCFVYSWWVLCSIPCPLTCGGPKWESLLSLATEGGGAEGTWAGVEPQEPASSPTLTHSGSGTQDTDCAFNSLSMTGCHLSVVPAVHGGHRPHPGRAVTSSPVSSPPGAYQSQLDGSSPLASWTRACRSCRGWLPSTGGGR